MTRTCSLLTASTIYNGFEGGCAPSGQSWARLTKQSHPSTITPGSVIHLRQCHTAPGDNMQQDVLVLPLLSEATTSLPRQEAWGLRA